MYILFIIYYLYLLENKINILLTLFINYKELFLY